MFKTLNDVPVPVKEFYIEDVVKVPTGGYFDEITWETDTFGNTTPVISKVPAYRSEVVVTAKPEGSRKPWSEVERIVRLGKPQGTIDSFIEQAQNNEAWQFHDEYLAWLAQQPEPEFDEGGHQLPVEPVGVEPVRIYTDPQPYRVAAAKLRRDTGRYEPIEHNGMMFDADIESYANIVGTIDSWDTLLADPLMAQSGMVDGDKMYWTLQDNTNVLVDKATLQGVVDAIRVRAGKLHAEYQAIKMQETKPANAL